MGYWAARLALGAALLMVGRLRRHGGQRRGGVGQDRRCSPIPFRSPISSRPRSPIPAGRCTVAMTSAATRAS